MNRFNCLFEDDDDDNRRTHENKINTPAPRKDKTVPQWVKTSASIPPTAPVAPVPEPKTHSSPKTSKKGKKSNSRQNKANLLKKLQSESKTADIVAIEQKEETNATKSQPATPLPAYLSASKTVSSPVISVPTNVRDPLHPSWAVMCIDDPTKPSKTTIHNYRLPPVTALCDPEEETQSVRYKRVLRALSDIYIRRRNHYITEYGADAYNKQFLSPNHDYNWMERETAYVPDIYDPYPPDYLPYVITPNGAVKDITWTNREYMPQYNNKSDVDDNTLASDDSDGGEYIEKFTKHTIFLSS